MITLVRIFAWLLLAAIVLMTLGPIGLRPISTMPVQFERLAAFGVVGLAFAIAYPRHIILVGLLILGAAIGLELLQNVMPGRHGRVIDFVAKAIGGGLGIGIGWLVTHWPASRKRPGW
jgi:hypothetical protein